jgi:hypothetical protein
MVSQQQEDADVFRTRADAEDFFKETTHVEARPIRANGRA